MNYVFVYGTLKLGQCRQSCWPIEPLQVMPAWVYGQLFDLGPYPAMIPGSSRVAGQVWAYSDADIVKVLKTLDEIEVTNQPGVPNEYDRVHETAYLLDGQQVPVQTYHFANQLQLKYAKLVTPSFLQADQLYAIWPTSSRWLEAIPAS